MGLHPNVTSKHHSWIRFLYSYFHFLILWGLNWCMGLGCKPHRKLSAVIRGGYQLWRAWRLPQSITGCRHKQLGEYHSHNQCLSAVIMMLQRSQKCHRHLWPCCCREKCVPLTRKKCVALECHIKPLKLALLSKLSVTQNKSNCVIYLIADENVVLFL
jgi:hypothetical protein